MAPISAALDAVEQFAQTASMQVSDALSAVENAAIASARQACRGIASAGEWALLSEAERGTWSRMCDGPYNEPGNSPPATEPPPFTGGQCPILYDVFIAGDTVQFPGPGTAEFNGVTGPISGLSWVQVGGNQNARQARLQTANGPVGISGGQASVHVDDIGTWSITSIVPLGGLPDDCGDPPSTTTPPTVSDPYNFGDSEDVPGAGPVATGRPTAAPGVPNIPVTAPEIPGIDTWFPQNLPADFRPEDRGVGDGANNAEPSETDPENYPFDDPPAGDVWVGARVLITNLPASDSRIANTGPDWITPDVLGNIRLVLRDGNGTIRLGNPYRITSLTSLVFRPIAGYQVLGVRVNKKAALNVTVTPILARDEREDPALA